MAGVSPPALSLVEAFPTFREIGIPTDDVGGKGWLAFRFAGFDRFWTSTPGIRTVDPTSGDSEHEVQGLERDRPSIVFVDGCVVGLAFISGRPHMTGQAGQGAKAASNDNRIARGQISRGRGSHVRHVPHAPH